jgi:hypothetical protein
MRILINGDINEDPIIGDINEDPINGDINDDHVLEIIVAILMRIPLLDVLLMPH